MSSVLSALKTTFLVLLSTIAALVIFLLVDVLYTLASSDDPRESFYQRYDYGWYTLKAGYAGEGAFGGERFMVYTDAHSHRTSGPDKARPEGPAQTIFLGDSFTFGINGPWEETFVGMYADAVDTKVINAGVASYSPTAYLIQYRKALEAGLLSKEHRVIVGLDISDVQDEASRWLESEEYDTPVRYSKLNQTAADRWFDRTFPAGLKMWSQVEKGARTLSRGRPEPGNHKASDIAAAMADIPRSAYTFRDWDILDAFDYAPLGVQGGLDRIEEKMTALADLANEAGGDVWILVYPFPAQMVHDSALLDWPEHARALCDKIDCKGVIDTFPAFHALRDANPDWYEDLYLNRDVHFTAHGNRIIFRALEDAFPAATQ